MTPDLILRENDPSWAVEIQDDVIEECNKHGGVVHIYVDKNSTQVSPWIQEWAIFYALWRWNFFLFQGNVYVKCPSIPAAMATVNALHGRWFAGMCWCAHSWVENSPKFLL